MDEGRTVMLKELLLYILLKWRMIIVFMIIFGALAGGIGVVKSYRTARNMQQQQENQDFSQYEEELTETEIQEVKDAVDDYITYDETYNSYKTYSDNSIRMRINPNVVPTEKIVYRISGNRDVINIIDSYSEMIPNDEICEKIEDSVDWNLEKVELSYISELISVTNSHLNSMAISGTLSNVIEENNDEENSGLMTIEIISDGEENCKQMGEIIQEYVTLITADIQQQFGNFSINSVSVNYNEEANSSLLNEQKNCLTEMNNISVLMKNIKSSLSEAQQTYFTALLDEEIKQLDVDNSNVEGIQNIEEIKIDYINVKYIIIGFAAGIFIICFCNLCRFLLNKRLMSPAYITEDLKVPVLGMFPSVKTEKKFLGKIDQWLISILGNSQTNISEEEKMKIVCMEIQRIIQKSNMNKIYIASTVADDKINVYMEELMNGIDDGSCNIEIGNSVLHNSGALKTLIESDGVIFVEKIGESNVDNICHEIQYCNECNINIMGAVIIGSIQ